MKKAGIKMVYKWNIFLVNLEPVIGSEQGKTRPVLIVSEEEVNEILPVVNVLPLTSFKLNRKIYQNEVFLDKNISGLAKDSIVLCYQIKTIDKTRLIKNIGCIDNAEIQAEIIEALSFQLGL